MDRQNNVQPEQNTNQQQNGGFSDLYGLLNLVFGERQQGQTSNSTAENNPQQNGSQGQQPQAQQQIPQFNFFIYPMPSPQGDNATTPGLFFFTPFFMPQEVRKPRASESAMKKLPIVVITKEHVNSQASCPICLEPFSLSIGQEENEVDDKTITTETNKHEPVRQMPCNHMFCESCLFQWLRQNNSCPLCRKEIETERTAQQQDINNTASNVPPNVPNVPLFGMINIANSSTPVPTPTPTTTSNDPHPHPSTHRPTISCALASVGCCEEIHNHNHNHNHHTQTQTPIITLPQCHHRFHASCLRTSLLVEGYPPDEFSRPLNFHCPTCRAPAILQSDVLKIPSVPHDEQQDRLGIPFSLPLTIHVPDSDDMDLD